MFVSSSVWHVLYSCHHFPCCHSWILILFSVSDLIDLIVYQKLSTAQVIIHHVPSSLWSGWCSTWWWRCCSAVAMETETATYHFVRFSRCNVFKGREMLRSKMCRYGFNKHLNKSSRKWDDYGDSAPVFLTWSKDCGHVTLIRISRTDRWRIERV